MQKKVSEIIQGYTDHINVEIQQRACEYLQIFAQQWEEEERTAIFDPIPFKGDENMLVDTTGRAILDDGDGAGLLIATD